MQLSTALNLPNRQVNAGGFGYGASLALDFTSGNQTLDPRITFTRSTTATRYNSSGLIESVAVNGPRFDYDPVTLAPMGLLIEEQRTNLLTFSEQFDNAIWTKSAGTLTTNTLVAPDGTLTADLFFEDTTAAQHVITHNLASSFTSGTTYTQSYFVKARGRTRLQINFRSDWFPANVEVNFDLVAKTATPAANATGTIQEVGNGWFRITATATADATGTSPSDTFLYLADASGNITYTGDGFSGIFIWGAQLEAGAFATSYIPTVASQVTRAADAASMTGANFSSWYNQASGSFYSEYLPTAVAPLSVAQLVFMVSNGTISNTIELNKRANADVSIRFSVVSGGVNQVFANLGVFTATATKVAIAYGANDFAGLINAGAAITDTSGNTPLNVSQMDIGRFVTGSGSLNGTIRKIAFYPRRLTNSELQALTS